MRTFHSVSGLISLLILAIGPAVGPASAQSQVVEPTGRWVTDRGEFFSPAEERALTAKLRDYADTTSTQIVVVTLQSLDGADAGQYATELGQQWGVGGEEHDNGIVILVSREEQEVFIATGMGMEGAVPDVIAGRIVRNVVVPAFREDQYYRGIAGAVDAVAAAARGEYEAAEVQQSSGDGDGADWASIFVILIIVVFLVRGLRGGGGRSGGKKVRRDSSAGSVVLWGGALGGFGGSSGGGGMGGGLGGFSGGGGSFGGGGAGGGW